MTNYVHDEYVTWQKMHEQWTSQQNKMRLKVRIEDMFDWEVPKQVTINYEKNQNFGSIKVNRNISQPRLNKQWRAKNSNDENKSRDKPKPCLRYIGGVDLSFTKPGAYEYDKACAGLMIFEYPSMRLIHEETEIVTLRHPYIAGFLAFREVGFLIKLVNKVKKERPNIIPQVILVDGNGILHYRRVGLATHLSMRVNIPCIGIAKKLLAIDNLNVEYLVPHLNEKLNKVGSFYKIYGFNNEQVGYAIRTKMNEDIVYVSPGNMIDYESSLKIIMLCVDKDGRYKLPIPTEKADFVTRKIIGRYQKGHKNPYEYENNDYKREYHNENRNDNYRNDNYRNTRDDDYQSKRVNDTKYKSKSKNENVSNNLSQSARRRNRKKKQVYNDDYKQGYDENYNRNDRYNNKGRQYQSKRVNNITFKSNNEKVVKSPSGNKGNKGNIGKNVSSHNGNLSKSAKRRNRRKKQWQKVSLNDL